MRVSNLFWKLSQESPVGKWEERQGKESSKGRIIKINYCWRIWRGCGGVCGQPTPWGYAAQKAILLVIGEGC